MTRLVRGTSVVFLTIAIAVPCGLLCVALSSGCRFVETTSDALADATEGTIVSDGFRGIARTAESLKDYSPAEEHYIGRAVAAQILARYKVDKSQELRDYVNLVGNALRASPNVRMTLTGYHFVVLEGDEVQAVSAPGGFVFLTAGTVRRAKDEDELAAVLAHEIAHVSLGHGISSVKAATRKRAFGLFGRAGAGAATAGAGADIGAAADLFNDVVGDIAGDLLVKGYSRTSELAADQAAIGYLKDSGYGTAGLASYLGTLAAEHKAGEGGWSSTHPSPQDRIDALQKTKGADLVTPGRDVRTARFAAALAKR